jgi:hypothetical protein
MADEHMNRADAVRLDSLLRAHGTNHCEAILTRKSGDDFGLGAAFIAKLKGNTWGITCKHVATSGEGIVFGSKKTNGPVPNGPAREGRNIAVGEMYISEDLDVAAFHVTEEESYEIGKSPFVLDGRIQILDGDRKRLIGVAVGCSGFPGFLAELIRTGDHQRMGLFASYTTFGPVVSMNDTVITADWAEKSVIHINHNAVGDITPTGGGRNIKGMSGSPCWMEIDGNIEFIGILCRGDFMGIDTHMVDILPSWTVVDFLESIGKQ